VKKLLVHCCCAHCAAYTIEYWRKQGYQVAGLWYNPNIHPDVEHRRRLESMKTLAKDLDLPMIVEEYDFKEYFQRVKGKEAARCRHCFRLRLENTAHIAREQGFDAFTTTLLISPQQKHELLCEVAKSVARESGVEFLYADLRKRYSNSRHITKPQNLYRQHYCGCIYSKWEIKTK
jgi:predicted adenine nucleotide alpha hydrolase (AANH) superfamily ATPase